MFGKCLNLGKPLKLLAGNGADFATAERQQDTNRIIAQIDRNRGHGPQPKPFTVCIGMPWGALRHIKNILQPHIKVIRGNKADRLWHCHIVLTDQCVAPRLYQHQCAPLTQCRQSGQACNLVKPAGQPVSQGRYPLLSVTFGRFTVFFRHVFSQYLLVRRHNGAVRCFALHRAKFQSCKLVSKLSVVYFANNFCIAMCLRLHCSLWDRFKWNLPAGFRRDGLQLT